jgi:cytochrome c biogenesis protein CcmG/thiol:disulfide interchange protein DsbE
MPGKGFRSCMLALLLTACVLSGPAIAIIQKGEPAPPFKLVSTSGQHITLANYRGYVLLIDFFATWCSPCRDSLPHLIKLNRKYGSQGLQILGLSLDEDGEKAVREFSIANKINYPMALASDALQLEYSIRSVPTLYVIGKKGIVVEKFMGYNEETGRRIEQLIKQQLSE